ncbi:helix-turn-helix domain-containing protein [Pseudonocardia nigra]|uniref:helix-turn-helix domain-containing protein n=1 Tax=Pseudonocardia nigra TaxID=1921578 RepID=UPI001C5F8173|nr:helix-turn-helix domain-containing protein [Pseudonocardia nigra]
MSRDPRELAGAWTRFQRHEFPAPAPDLAPFVAKYWIVEWGYASPYRQLIVPYPHVHLTVQDGGVPEVHGVSSGHVVRVLDGVGRVFGVEFRPGGFRPFLGSPVSALTDRTVPAADVPGLPAAGPARPVDVAAVEEWLRAARPEPDPTALRVADVVATVVTEPGIRRVDDLAERCGTSVRRLQRLFAEYVGVGPKWVIRRYRLREATERMARGGVADWAGLAAELGYADQAHFTRDFAAMFGEPPTHYAARY